MQLIKYRFAQAHRAIEDMAADLSANSIALFADAVNMGDHFFSRCPISTADNVLLAFFNKFIYVPDLDIRRIDLTHTAYMGYNFDTLRFEQQLGQCSCCDTSSSFACR